MWAVTATQRARHSVPEAEGGGVVPLCVLREGAQFLPRDEESARDAAPISTVPHRRRGGEGRPSATRCEPRRGSPAVKIVDNVDDVLLIGRPSYPSARQRDPAAEPLHCGPVR